MTHTFTTTITLPDETEAEVAVAYVYHRGCPATLTDPPELAGVEIQSIVPDVPLSVYDDLVWECEEDYAAYCADAAEYRAGLRRDCDD